MRQQLVEVDPPYLAEEIITDILKRLPVKSLIRFQCVCKDWKNLIKSPWFVTDHLHYSDHQNSCLLLDYEIFSDQPLQLRLLDWEMQIHQIHTPRNSNRIIGSINGLFCLYPFVLWNPATKEVKQLPKPRKDNQSCGTAGFGYCPILNDYKIVRIYYECGYEISGAEVYSLSTDSWKDVDLGVLKGVCLSVFPRINVSADGSIFWLGMNLDKQGNSNNTAIVSYDIAGEVFTLTPCSIPVVSFTRFTVYDDKLALFSKNHEWIELWVLEKGINSSPETWSWIKKHTKRAPCDFIFWATIWRNHLTVCDRCWPIQEGVIPASIPLYMFEIPTNEFKVGVIPKVGRNIPYHVFNYVESLVPLNNIHIEQS